MAGYPPNPLVVDLANRLNPPPPAAQAGQRQQQPNPQDVADDFAGKATPELMTYAGLLGGLVNARNENWRVLYLDLKLLTWLLVKDDAIKHADNNPNGPLAPRDVVWVRADALVTQGEGPVTAGDVEDRFLRGAFTTAAEFTAKLAGGTYAAPAGGQPEVLTPFCCGRRTR